ncbi:hypothetical protein [Cohnella sp. GbtcB17]|uniref:hypothetical protein n=1 Tax=Cohnella sp. GbtcB17 TaxID=2824762 RepID=UPI001C3118BD|nr:hypothetical protein [Cohnella sp. GbtcB17]
MGEKRKKSYVKVMFYVLLDIRNMSTLDSINSLGLRSRMSEINKLADAFHNLPDLIYSNQFDENLFWEQLKMICPNKVENYRRVFESALNA